MILRILLMLVLAFAGAGCDSLKKKDARKKPSADDMKDQQGDVAFQGFVGRLRKAVAARDKQLLATMMTENFGYRLEPPGEGEGVFEYWDQTNMWKDVESILSQKFMPSGNFMVAPPEFVTNPQYTGYRAGITWYGNSWKFAYFVRD